MFSLMFQIMLIPYLSIIFILISPAKLALQPIRHHRIDLHSGYTYIFNHIKNKIGFGVSVLNLRSCIDLCFNHDFCRTAVYDSQLSTCSLFEECVNQGQVIPNAQMTLISFQVCDGEPINMIFVQSLLTSVPVATATTNLRWVTDLASSSSYPFFVNNYIYVSSQTVINVYETDTYTLTQTIQLPVSSELYFAQADSQDTVIYYQNGDSNLYIYSPLTNIIGSVNTSFINFVFCYSASFIVVNGWPWSVIDVYLRSTTNNSATFIYRISSANQLTSCVILNDYQLIGIIYTGGLQTTILNKTSYNSTVITLPLNTTYLPTGSRINTDAAGRIYTMSGASMNVSTIFLPDGRLIGVHEGTGINVGRTSKYKFIFMTSNVNRTSIYEYTP